MRLTLVIDRYMSSDFKWGMFEELLIETEIPRILRFCKIN